MFENSYSSGIYYGEDFKVNYTLRFFYNGKAYPCRYFKKRNGNNFQHSSLRNKTKKWVCVYYDIITTNLFLESRYLNCRSTLKYSIFFLG